MIFFSSLKMNSDFPTLKCRLILRAEKKSSETCSKRLFANNYSHIKLVFKEIDR